MAEVLTQTECGLASRKHRRGGLFYEGESSRLRLALYQPDIPQNVGAAIRIAACFGAGVDIVEPCGFAGGAREIRRVAMDYALAAPPVFHASWTDFRRSIGVGARLILLTTKANVALWDFSFSEADAIVLGRESAGVPEDVHEAVHARLLIPLAPGARSLNVAVAGAVALSEARRQLRKSL
jgi:tRNA (cytidine/uridine-2'-O-)-methyltransferase